MLEGIEGGAFIVYVGEDRADHIVRGLTLKITPLGAVFRLDDCSLDDRWVPDE